MKQADIANYLKQVYQKEITVTGVGKLGETEDGLKEFGYGNPLLLRFLADGEEKSAVLSSMRTEGGFGHDHFSDRAQILIWQHSTFNNLPKHVKSIDTGYFTADGRLESAGDATEYFVLMEEVAGVEYFMDLERISAEGATELDEARAHALSDYLADIHARKSDNQELYVRRIRDTVGHGECIMGLMDSYPTGLDFITDEELLAIEKTCIDWRWKLKIKTDRLCMVHGDFHPWNVMFREGTDFSVLDRSRGEWGEAADDVSSMAMNYIFYSLQKHGGLEGDFKKVYNRFMDHYLTKTEDWELLKVIQLFYAFRGLVVASPIWYPNLDYGIRVKLFNFIKNTLAEEEFDYQHVNSYLSE
ncbi:MAG: phosphotransferase family protein [Candidatus Methanogasteraceae archaeon]